MGKEIRGEYFEGYNKGANLVLLRPDVAAAFADDASVNVALRSLMKAALQSIDQTRRPSGCAVERR